MPLRRFADFRGRSRRREYWSWTLALLALESALYVALFAAAFQSGARLTMAAAVPLVLLVLLGLGAFVPSLAVTVRRLYDTGRSGNALILLLLPVIGWIVLVAWLCAAGAPGPNAYGPDPKGGARSLAGG